MSDRPSPGLCERGSKTSSTPVGKNGDSTAARSPTESVAAMPRKDKVRGWGRKDVSRWLEKRSLVKFVPLFLRNGIVGADLVESRLSFLYEEGVGVSDREQLLAEIYMLLHPDSPRLVRRSPPSSSSLSLSAVHPRDREKYQAALQVAKSPPSQNSSSPVVLIGSRNRSPAAVTLTVTPTSTSTLTSATTLSVPTSKPRSRSESGLETEGSAAMTSPSPGRKYLKRKSTPAVHDYLQRGTTAAQNASLFETLEAEGRVCLQCVRVHRSEAAGSKFGFSYQTLPDSCLLVTNLKPSPTLPLQIGDRILEVNGILLPGHKGSTIETVLSKSASLDVVVVRHMSSVEQDNKTEPNHYDKLQQELVMGEVRWQSLRQLLTSLQHKSFDPLTLTGTLSRVEDMEDMKKRATLEMEVEELQRTCAELTGRMNSLQGSLTAKEQELSLVKRDRDRAVGTLRTRLLKYCAPSSPSSSSSSSASSSSSSSSSHHHRGCGGGGGGVGAGGDDRDGDDEDDDVDPPRRTRTVENSQDLHALFFEHVDLSLTSMETSNASKEDVLAVLRELTGATKRHAHFVDRLISVVSERAPWMMEELSALQDASELPDPAAAVPAAGAACGGGVNAAAPSPTAVTLLPPSPPSSPPPQQQQQKQQQQQTPSSQQAKDSEAERIIVV